MASLIISRAGFTFEIVQSNKGIRLLEDGAEIFRRWPKSEAQVVPSAGDPAPVDPAPEPESAPPPADITPPATSQSAPTIASITVSNGSVEVRGVSRPGNCYALINQQASPMSGSEILGYATAAFAVPAHQTTTGSIDTTAVAPGSYLHLTIHSDDGQYSIDNPQIWK